MNIPWKVGRGLDPPERADTAAIYKPTQETTMFATTILEPAAIGRADAIYRIFSACLGRIERYLARRIAIEWLRDLDERALCDVGLARSQIVAAVHGFMRASEFGEGMKHSSSTAPLATVSLRTRGRASTMESIPWS